MYLAGLFQSDEHSSWFVPGMTLLIGVASLAANLWAGSRTAAKASGVLEAKVDLGLKAATERHDELQDAIASEFARLQQADRDQWKVIGGIERALGDTRETVARMEGKLNGRSASAGG